MRLAAQRLLYGPGYKPSKEEELEAQTPEPMWGWAKDDEADEGVTVFELQASTTGAWVF